MRLLLTSLLLVSAFAQAVTPDGKHKLVLIAGKPSHPPGMHEFRAGCLLLKPCLDAVPGVTTFVYSNGWPNVENAFEGANAVVIYADGGGVRSAARTPIRHALPIASCAA